MKCFLHESFIQNHKFEGLFMILILTMNYFIGENCVIKEVLRTNLAKKDVA